MTNVNAVDQERLSCLPGNTVPGHLFNTAVDYTDNHVVEELHPAFEGSDISYNNESDQFLPRADTHTDEDALSDTQQVFAEAMKQYEKDADPKYKTGIDLTNNTHTWDDVLKHVEAARDKYKGVGKEGVLTSIHSGLRNFHTAAPAIEAWLKLLPSTTIYGSIFCGGLTIILEAAIRLGKLREDTYEAIDQIPLRLERAEAFMRTYRDAKMKKQAADLYKAVIDALHHILGWYKRKAGIKYLSSFTKGPAYASTLKLKMKGVEDAAQAMEDQAGLSQHMRLKDIRHVTWQTKGQLNDIERTTGELKALALEARNHIYAVFRDIEAWQDIVQCGALSARDALLRSLDHDSNQLLCDIEEALRQIFLVPLTDQDRAIAIIQDPVVEEWLVEPGFGALLVHANGRRHDNISPASVACAMIIHLFTNTITTNRIPIITLYWFCGSHTNRPNGNALGLMRSLNCQLLLAGPFDHGYKPTRNFDGQDLSKLLDMFTKLLRQLPDGTAVVCVIDGISFYEDAALRDNTCKLVKKLVKLTRFDAPIFKVLISSAIRTSHIHREPCIEKHAAIVDIPQHVNGAKQGFNQSAMVQSTELKVRRLSKSLPAIHDRA
ncbi:hypothetical protein ACLMJK_000529 [Lecanora helva]